MSNEYMVVTISGETIIVEETFTDATDAENLLASGTGSCILHGHNFVSP
jgi:hypothetical protein